MLGVLEEARAVSQALEELGYSITQLPLSPPLEQARAALMRLNADLVFNLFEGFPGYPETEAAMANLLSDISLTYTGCPGRALALALDKGKAKALLEAEGVHTPAHQTITTETLPTFRLSYPCIVKPCTEDASHGISEESIVKDSASLQRQVARICELFDGRALVEEFIGGREFNVTILGTAQPQALPISEIVYSLPPGLPRILTFAAKWEPQSAYFQGTRPVCPAQIDIETQKLIVRTALLAFKLLDCSGYARVDMRLGPADKLYVLEVNPNPDISPDSGAARQARAAGMTYRQFIEAIALLALEGKRL